MRRGFIKSKVSAGRVHIWQNIIDYANANAFTLPSIATQGYMETLFNQITAMDVFDSFTIQAHNDLDTGDFALIDWIRISKMTISGAMEFTTHGWRKTNTNQMIISGLPLNEGEKYSLNDAGAGGVSYDDEGGVFVSANESWLRIWSGNSVYQRVNRSENLVSGFNLSGSRLKYIQRLETVISGHIGSNKIDRETGLLGTNLVSNIIQYGTSNRAAAVTFLSTFSGKSITQGEKENIRSYINNYLISISLAGTA